MNLPEKDLYEFLEEKYLKYNSPSFILHDPICVPHGYSLKEDIEISAFLMATIAWGRRDVIIRNGKKLMNMMGESPYDFVMNSTEKIDGFKHRTFNESDLNYFIGIIKNIYLNYNGLEGLFTRLIKDKGGDIQAAISAFKTVFFELPHEPRITKHISDPLKGSSAKRINMYLRWMVRRDNRGVDFGLWEGISPSVLHLPLDVHTGRVARKLGLLQRKQDDWRAVKELTAALRKYDPNDPAKYDFALFGLGIEEQF
ncbi:MAG: TIGR02757 family protein [Flavobacteriales bacterium]|nr:TIGR02757 family protein [Flavobacteriales bacterium]